MIAQVDIIGQGEVLLNIFGAQLLKSKRQLSKGNKRIIKSTVV